MYTIHPIVIPEAGRSYLILDDKDIIQSGDLIRNADYVSDSDIVMDHAINRMNWTTVDEGCPAWIGNPVKRFRTYLKDFGRYEFMRIQPKN